MLKLHKCVLLMRTYRVVGVVMAESVVDVTDDGGVALPADYK